MHTDAVREAGRSGRAYQSTPHALAPSLRRGAAFGVAGVVKGLGIMAMKNYGIMDALKVITPSNS